MTWMNFENIMLSEERKKEKVIDMIAFIWNAQNRASLCKRWIGGYLGLGMGTG
jgi:hypothetical protein